MPTPLLYLPGLDGTGRLLYRQRALHERFDVHCVSYPQDRLLGYEELADLGAEALEQRPGNRPAVVLAESFGGAVALMLALRRPDLVERLILVNTFAYFPRRLWLNISILASQFFPNRPSHPATRIVRGPFFFSPDVLPNDRDEWWDRTADVPMRGYALRLQVIAGLDLRARLCDIHVPALVLVAPDDRVVPAPAGRDLARRLPLARKLEMHAGHAAMAHPGVNIAELLADRRYWVDKLDDVS
jgi:pimeloyl-ACP methyl ester carboxylesterase